MTRLIIFACLLAVQLNRGLSVEIVTFSKAKITPELNISERGASNCVVETNKGEKYEYEPDYGASVGHPKIHPTSIHTCSISIIKPTTDDTGSWTITQNNENGKSKVYKYNLYHETIGIINPADSLTIYKGHYASVKIADDLDDIVACQVTPPKKETFDILSENVTNIERFDICGIRVMVDDEFNGQWYLIAIKENNELIYTEFKLNVVDDNKLITDQQNISLKIGSQADIWLSSIESSYCQLTDSHGVQLPLRIGQCKYTIDVVTPYHAGLWKASYGVQGRVDPIEIDIMVTTYDPEAVITSIDVTDNYAEVNMLCRLLTAANLQYCLFISPNGTTLHISPGIGIKNYEFYKGTGDGKTCGITIHKPANQDYGIWRCEMGLKDGGSNKRYGSFLYLDRNEFDSKSLTNYAPVPWKNINAFGYDVSVKRNDDFTIKCGVDTALHYCWLRSPNGTTYSIAMDKNSLSPTTLLYTGLGFELGECGAIIQNAVDDYEGTWTCYMGIKNQSEIEATLTVNVADNYILAEETTMTFDGKSNPTLFCQLLPHLNKNIEYCRWIRPDGHGIYGNAKHRYMSEMFDGRCGLVILGNELQEEDVGRWTCVAGLSGKTIEEVSTTIDVNMPSMPIATLVGIIIGACALFAVTASILILVNLRKRRLAAAPPKNPPPYNAEEVAGIPPKLALHEQIRYDQKDWID
ncbi:hypothetical protein KPH14_006856 [Odynerus spinipes]|uniref:Ig-like domain-containing protein n=1 Tax=Odynerus spinipes TaxID=1348599 RepID=A0AAD9RSK2_9HYME|nr:hypothetical protein KPH14_006856 [Odynerus spinipes]